jgi:hypothetical protein
MQSRQRHSAGCAADQASQVSIHDLANGKADAVGCNQTHRHSRPSIVDGTPLRAAAAVSDDAGSHKSDAIE